MSEIGKKRQLFKSPDFPLIAQRGLNHNKSLRPLSWAKQTVGFDYSNDRF